MKPHFILAARGPELKTTSHLMKKVAGHRGHTFFSLRSECDYVLRFVEYQELRASAQACLEEIAQLLAQELEEAWVITAKVLAAGLGEPKGKFCSYHQRKAEIQALGDKYDALLGRKEAERPDWYCEPYYPGGEMPDFLKPQIRRGRPAKVHTPASKGAAA